MSINIKGTSTKSSQTTSKKSNSSGKASKTSEANSSKTATADSIDLTATASTLQQIEQSLSDIPIIDSARVENVSQSIENGDYEINDDTIAERIINSETALLTQTKKQP
ncbi:MAG: flagellar biosynthesis anti-sigma factor FlgM [Cycloclasticus sp.]|nr:flagellar biosynthesis anti-sigma factor FlgM [Cycloclasticus sp.]MBQ0789599.1 flagellar biosynthesis anti-sigma factor FlgM [Cycloclasticus sp.]